MNASPTKQQRDEARNVAAATIIVNPLVKMNEPFYGFSDFIKSFRNN